MSIIHLTDENFDQKVLKSHLPVLVDFWADWCMPCKMISPILDELAKEYDGKLRIAKFNVDEGQTTASRYGIMSIPTLILFKDGKVLNQISGAMNKKQLMKEIHDNI